MLTKIPSSLFCKQVHVAYNALLHENRMSTEDIRYFPNAGFEAGFVYEGDPLSLKVPKGYKLCESHGCGLYFYKVILWGLVYKPLFFIQDCRGWDWKMANDPHM